MAVALADAAPAAADDGIDEVIGHYRRELRRKAVLPWAGSEWVPQTLGPTWQIDSKGRWVLPDASLGWLQLGWIATRLQIDGDPMMLTLEQARWLLWWSALDEAGRFVYRDGVLQRLKGWGKDPIAAALAALEAFGPARFLDWDRDEPVATDVPEAWVQLAAVSLEQTKNTTRLFPRMFTPESIDEYGIRIGKELVYGLGDERLIQAVTSSPATLEGARATFTIKNETQHWLANNEGHEMAAVIERNATKSRDGAARTLGITNAFEPSEDSSAQHDREAWESTQDGQTVDTGLLYDSIEAPADAPLTIEDAPAVVTAIRGDSVWLDIPRIVASISDSRNPPSRSRRFWYNQIVAAEDAWVDGLRFEMLSAPAIEVAPAEQVTAFFDGSKSDDATGLVACRVSDGHVVTVGMWQRPPGRRGELWVAPRSEIDAAVDGMFARYNVVGFWADPSHTVDDETGERYWDDTIDGWHHRYSDRLELWAMKGKHSIMWDMASPTNTREFTSAAERTVADIDSAADLVEYGEAPSMTWDGDNRLRRHVRNARRYPNRYGVSLWKGHRESPSKVDLAVCMVGARMVRRRLQLEPPKKKKRAGRVVGSGRR